VKNLHILKYKKEKLKGVYMNIKVYKGLDGVCVDETTLSKVDGVNGILTYLGYNIDQLVSCSFEEITYLFLNNRLPNVSELNTFKTTLMNTSNIDTSILDYIRKNSAHENPMSLLRTSISMLSSTYSNLENSDETTFTENAIKLIFHTSIICAAICRSRSGKDIIEPKEGLSFTANFLYMVFGKNVEESMIKTMDLAFILHIDHSFNASTFTARVVTSTMSDIISAVTAAIGSLKGPLHGGANTEVMKLLMEIENIDNVESWLENALKNKRKIMGFGHRVYKVLDPRAKHLKAMSHHWGSMTNNTKWFEMSNKLEKLVFEKKGINANVDFYSASTYYSMGIDIENYTMLFALARVVGWISHIKEQMNNNRIIRPKAKYVGPMNVEFININERN
jgi:citrate synthase